MSESFEFQSLRRSLYTECAGRTLVRRRAESGAKSSRHSTATTPFRLRGPTHLPMTTVRRNRMMRVSAA